MTPQYEIRLIIGQYKQRYDGELMPNVLDAWDEYMLEDNWQGYADSLAKYKADEGKDFESVRELVVTVDQETVLNLFRVPSTKGETHD